MSTTLTKDAATGLRQSDLLACMEQFYFAYRAFTAQADQILAERRLGRVHHRILYFVGRNPDVAVSALIDILGVSKQALNAPLRQLIEMGMISSTTADRDRRVRLLKLTESGSELESLLSGIQMQHLNRAFSAQSKSAVQAWRKIMASLASLA